jgi:hypothetical protein
MIRCLLGKPDDGHSPRPEFDPEISTRYSEKIVLKKAETV